MGPRQLQRIAFIACCLAGCPSSPESDAPPAGVEIGREELEALAELGYLDHTTAPADRTRSAVTVKESGAAPGPTLVTTPSCRARLVALDGEVVHRWADEEGCESWASAELMPSGDLVALGARPGPHPSGSNGRYLVRVGWQGEASPRARINAHHHFASLPSGTTAVLTREPQRMEELGLDELQLVDHVSFLRDLHEEPLRVISLLDVYRNSAPRFELELPHEKWRHGRDLFHSNAVHPVKELAHGAGSPAFAAGQLVLTLRHQGCVVVIDPERQEIVWEWGRGELEGPHDGTVLPSGNVLVFDNGIHRAWSRVVEVDPESREIVWEYHARPKGAFFSEFRGTSQRLPNGNTLITESSKGRVFEVTRDGTLVWEYWNPTLDDEGRREVVQRAVRHPPGFLRAPPAGTKAR